MEMPLPRSLTALARLTGIWGAAIRGQRRFGGRYSRKSLRADSFGFGGILTVHLGVGDLYDRPRPPLGLLVSNLARGSSLGSGPGESGERAGRDR